MGSCSWIRQSLHKLRALSFEEAQLLLHAFLFLPLIHLGLRLAGYRRLRLALERLAPLRASRLPEEQVRRRAAGIARIVSVAANRGPYRAGCLRRSLLTWWLLRRRGIDSAIRFGVRLEGDKLLAHAWVESGGLVLEQPPGLHEQFRALDDSLPPAFLEL